MRPSKKNAIEKFIEQKGIVCVSDVMKKFALKKSTVFTYMYKLGVLTSFNSRGQYYILPQHHQFDENGLLFFGEIGFYQGGNLLAAICHLVENSPQGLGVRELDQTLKTDSHSHLPGLYRTGRLHREPAKNRPGRAYIYFSPENTRGKEQREACFAPEESKVESSNVEIVPDELQDVIEVLLTLLAHPDFSAKSISLSLQRRGRKVSCEFVKKVFGYYKLSKKKC